VRALAAWLLFLPGEDPPVVNELMVVYARGSGLYRAVWTACGELGHFDLRFLCDDAARVGVPQAVLTRFAELGLAQWRLVEVSPPTITPDDLIRIMEEGRQEYASQPNRLWKRRSSSVR